MKILCYSPYNMWELHGLWEGTLLQALRLHGAEIHYVLCDGLYKECDVFWAFANGYPRHELACTQCQHRVSALMFKMQMPYQWLGRYLQPEETVLAQQWSDALETHQFLNATYEDWQIGEWVEGSVHSHFRVNQFDFNNPMIVDVYRGYLYSGLVAAFALDRLLKVSQPDTLLLFNGRMSNTRVALELAQRHGIQTICHERGLTKESLRLTENMRITLNFLALQTAWKSWAKIPLTRHQIQLTSDTMSKRFQGKNVGWVAANPVPTGQYNDLRDQLDIAHDKKVWALFPSSEDEIISEKERLYPYQTQAAWIEDTLQFVTKHPDIILVIRVHPNIGNRSYQLTGAVMGGNNQQQLDYFTELNQRLPQNVRMILPDGKISSYDLMDIACVGLSLFSSVGLEMATKGKMCVVSPKSPYADTEFVKTFDSLENYLSLLQQLVQTPKDYHSTHLISHALRFAYFMFHRWNLAFPLVKMPNPHTGELNYQSLDELKPGREPSLELACQMILGNKPVFPVVQAFDKVISDSDERHWQSGIAFEAGTFVTTETIFMTDVSSSKLPVASVIIPCYNYGAYLHDAVSSILEQGFQDFEIIIVNDGSTDDTYEVCDQILKAYPDYAITVIHQPNSGQPAHPRNRGLSLARGTYALCLDADDMLSPQTLQACVNSLEQNPHISIAYPYLREMGDSHLLWKPTEYDPALLLYWNFIPTAAMFRLQAWKDCGGYSTNVISHEDWDFWIHCASKGHFGKLAPEATMWYRIHGDSLIRANDDPVQRLRLKAQMMLNRPGMYGHQQLQWAQGIMNQADWALNIKINPSYMPKFEQDNLPESYHAMLKTWKNMQLSPYERLKQERHLYQKTALWFKTDTKQILIRCNSDDGNILDGGPLSNHPEALPKQIWAANEAALQHIKQQLTQTDTKVKIVPRFIPEQAIQRTNTLDFDAPHGMIVVLKNIAFLETLKPLLSQTSAELALAILWQGLAVEDAYDQLSQKLEEMGFTEESLPELVLLDAEQIQNTEDMFPDAIRAVLIEAEADVDDKWQLSALHCGLLLLAPSGCIRPFADYVQRQTAPDYLRNWAQAGNDCYQAIPEFAASWNKSVWDLMQAAIAEI